MSRDKATALPAAAGLLQRWNAATRLAWPGHQAASKRGSSAGDLAALEGIKQTASAASAGDLAALEVSHVADQAERMLLTQQADRVLIEEAVIRGSLLFSAFHAHRRAF